ncbi:Structural maintenance of chromosomes protein 3 [Linum perenne]
MWGCLKIGMLDWAYFVSKRIKLPLLFSYCLFVGANGSGKSNFFHAIRFVLSDLFQNLRSEDRHTLLHEGAGHQVLSAFVEIVFDNYDNRIPVDKEEVRLRRTISSKKDEYFLDGKHITKSEVMNLLESAGFSRSNPYYVVQQGKIASLTLMKDSERLDLLKEIGGNKRKQIIQVVQYLDDRLRELDAEKEELRKYQQLDKQRKSLEYTIYDRELQDARQKLAEVEVARNKVSENSSKMHQSVLDAHERCKEIDTTLKDLTKELHGLNKEKEAVEKQHTQAMKIRTELELDVKDMQERISGASQAKEDAIHQLKFVEKEIQDSVEELNKISPSYEEQVLQEKKITKEIMEREKQLSILYQKQGRATQFASKAERDKWLQKEIDDLQREDKLKEEINRIDADLEKRNKFIESRKAEMESKQSVISQSRKGFGSHKAQRDKLQDERKALWGNESALDTEIDKLKTELEKAKKSLDHATPGDVRRGLNSMRRICKEHDITGVFGPIIELLDCDEKFFTAVEVTAGNSLFHVVVKDDGVSTQIIRQLNAQKGGRVTFIPLNRVKAPRVNYPTNSDDVVPLKKKLKFKETFDAAFQQVFGRTVICRDLDVATRIARTDGLDCITLEGDQVSKKGGMTGGFYDHRRSKLKFMTNIIQSQNLIKVKEERKITELVTEQQKIDAQHGHDKSEVEQLKQDIANANKQKELYYKARETETRKAELETNLTTNLKRRKQELEAIISSPEDDALHSDAELKAQELQDAKSLVEVAKKELERVSGSINGIKKELKKIKDEKISLKTLEDEHERTLQDEAKELEQLLSNRNALLAKQEEFSNKIRELGPLSSDAFDTHKRKNIKELQKMLHRCNEELQKFSHVNKKALDQYVNFWEQREELQKRQAELDAGDEKIKELIRVLDQRKDESIERTFKGVARHFREVFSELVQGGHGHLVMMKKKDGDQGDDDNEDDEPRQADVEGRVEKYIGVKVKVGVSNLFVVIDWLFLCGSSFQIWKVSFTGQGETQSMKQLSGGQKTVVAMTLIFAIQRCDPAPFYLFDEIDAALDPQYRTAVGNMIRRLADMANTQFITTTFRPELVKVADKIYGVTHKNRVSLVNVVSKDGALDFIEHDQSHNAV